MNQIAFYSSFIFYQDCGDSVSSCVGFIKIDHTKFLMGMWNSKISNCTSVILKLVKNKLAAFLAFSLAFENCFY